MANLHKSEAKAPPRVWIEGLVTLQSFFAGFCTFANSKWISQLNYDKLVKFNKNCKNKSSKSRQD